MRKRGGGGVTDSRWETLVRYDPDINAAVGQLTPFGNSAIAQFKDAYLTLQDKEIIPALVSDIIESTKASKLPPSNFKEIENKTGISVYSNGKEYWVNGQFFTALGNARAYASAMSKKQKQLS
ncbi:MAG: hypothetical protein NW215_00950 [Hyphomicrobiales bacterium]|nr:hypothetical protein [Hyphomicrobiales bacterium]